MINVIKRNGSVEPFQVEKINSWWLWSTQAKNIPLGEGTEAVQRAVRSLSSVTTTAQIQRALINELIALGTWNTILMAGSLEASLIMKAVHGDTIPTVQQQMHNMHKLGYTLEMPFTQNEWDLINNMIDHNRNFHMPQFAVKYIMDSYALGNVVTGERVETPQFTYMRMALAVGASYPLHTRVGIVAELYELYSTQVISAPTPNFTHLGTPNNGLSSCCLYTAGDDRKSLAAANLITYVMTYSSAGLGYHQNVRSVGDAVRGGKIKHQGDIFYLKSNAASAAANRQSKRGGAINAYLSAYSKEINHILAGREPTAAPGKAINGIDVTLVMTRDFIKRANSGEAALCFTEHSNPAMFKAMYTGDPKKLEELMAQAVKQELETAGENSPKLVSPRTTIGNLGRVTVSTGRNFAALIDNINHHTPFKEPIYGSNLCVEIVNPTKPYEEITDLWREDDDVSGEVSMCNLGAVNHDLVADNPALHKRACLAALRVIDYCIHHSYYELKHIGYTAKKRMNAAVGVMNTATYMARNKLKFDSDEGLKHISEFAERHMYFLIESSLALGIERGNAPWIHKTKWAGYTNDDGEYVSAWLPIDTQSKKLAKELGLEPTMPWEDLRARIAANKGIGHSVLGALMPGESSSKALGASNSVYPIRDLGLDKTDSTTNISWCAVGAGDPNYEYQIAYDLSTKDTIRYYAAWQMWLDGAVSADFWLPFEKGKNVIEIEDVIAKYATMYAYGMKTHYYTVAKTQKTSSEQTQELDNLTAGTQAVFTGLDEEEEELDGPACTMGGCSI